MRFWPILKFLLVLSLTGLLIWLLATPQQVGGKNLPALGRFFNPFSGFWKNGEPMIGAAPKLPADLPGLKDKVEVVFDDLMVPHIFAQNLEDAYLAQGYLTARDRLWQMDMTVRKAAGRLSEVLGDRTLEIDRMSRRKGLVFAAENSVIAWNKSAQGMARLNAYVAGINAYVERLKPADYPFEFKLLGYEPEPWSVFKCALVMESMAESLCSQEDDIESTFSLEHFGRATFDSLYPEWNPKQSPIIPDEGQWKDMPTLPRAASATSVPYDALTYGTLRLDPISRLDRGPKNEADVFREGSNNWAIAGSKTQSGNPILANDPHLNLTLPSIWYQIQIHAKDLNAYGVTLPGLPGIVIGFNEDIAWGMTNVGHDVSDYYKISWVDAERTKYRLDGEQKSAQTRVEAIKIQGKPVFYDTVRYTVWGPVTYDHMRNHPLRDCALRWGTHDAPPANLMDGLPMLNFAKNYDEYRNSIGTYDYPAQNVVFATRSGDIALSVQGRLPIRAPEQGRFVQDGSRWINGWHNYIPQNQLPHMRNPARGFVSSANQHSAPPAYPYYFLGGFEDYRGRYINTRLDSLHQGATVEDMKALQLDNFSQRAADALPLMLQMLDRNQLSQTGKGIVSELEKWRYTYDSDLKAPTYFEVWVDSLYANTWDEMRILEQQGKPILYPETWRTIEMLERDTLNRFFDVVATPAREIARDIVQRSFDAMLATLAQKPTQSKAWADWRGFALYHLARLEPLSRMDVRVGGHKSAPNALTRTHGPSWRMVVDMSDPIKGYGVYPGGQSGNPGSKFYDNMVDTWAAGKYFELLFLKSADEASERVKTRHVMN